GSKIGNNPVDLGLGTDIDTTRRLIKNKHRGIGGQPFAQDDFLLVATGKGADQLIEASGTYMQLFGVISSDAPLRARIDKAQTRHHVQNGQGNVGSDAEIHDKAMLVTIFGYIGDAALHRRAGRTDMYLLAFEPDLSAGWPINPKEHTRHFGTPGTYQT